MRVRWTCRRWLAARSCRRGTFPRQFRAAYGETPYSYLMTRRVERAMALLRGGMSVTDACMEVGCTSLGSFSSRFTEIVGRRRAHTGPGAPRRAGDARLRRQGPHPADQGRNRAGSEKRSARPPPSVDRMTISLQYTHITVNDLDESLAFYRDALGLEVRNDVASGGFRWVTLGSDAQPGPRDRALRAARRPLAGRRRRPAGTAHQGRPADDRVPHRRSRPTFEKVRASGAEVLQEPIDQPWGPRDCAFRDPSGNTVRISQRPKD